MHTGKSEPRGSKSSHRKINHNKSSKDTDGHNISLANLHNQDKNSTNRPNANKITTSQGQGLSAGEKCSTDSKQKATVVLGKTTSAPQKKKDDLRSKKATVDSKRQKHGRMELQLGTDNRGCDSNEHADDVKQTEKDSLSSRKHLQQSKRGNDAQQNATVTLKGAEGIENKNAESGQKLADKVLEDKRSIETKKLIRNQEAYSQTPNSKRSRSHIPEQILQQDQKQNWLSEMLGVAVQAVGYLELLRIPGVTLQNAEEFLQKVGNVKFDSHTLLTLERRKEESEYEYSEPAPVEAELYNINKELEDIDQSTEDNKKSNTDENEIYNELTSKLLDIKQEIRKYELELNQEDCAEGKKSDLGVRLNSLKIVYKTIESLKEEKSLDIKCVTEYFTARLINFTNVFINTEQVIGTMINSVDHYKQQIQNRIAIHNFVCQLLQEIDKDPSKHSNDSQTSEDYVAKYCITETIIKSSTDKQDKQPEASQDSSNGTEQDSTAVTEAQYGTLAIDKSVPHGDQVDGEGTTRQTTFTKDIKEKLQNIQDGIRLIQQILQLFSQEHLQQSGAQSGTQNQESQKETTEAKEQLLLITKQVNDLLDNQYKNNAEVKQLIQRSQESQAQKNTSEQKLIPHTDNRIKQIQDITRSQSTATKVITACCALISLPFFLLSLSVLSTVYISKRYCCKSSEQRNSTKFSLPVAPAALVAMCMTTMVISAYGIAVLLEAKLGIGIQKYLTKQGDIFAQLLEKFTCKDTSQLQVIGIACIFVAALLAICTVGLYISHKHCKQREAIDYITEISVNSVCEKKQSIY